MNGKHQCCKVVTECIAKPSKPQIEQQYPSLPPVDYLCRIDSALYAIQHVKIDSGEPPQSQVRNAATATFGTLQNRKDCGDHPATVLILEEFEGQGATPLDARDAAIELSLLENSFGKVPDEIYLIRTIPPKWRIWWLKKVEGFRRLPKDHPADWTL
jgi:hypothetical protein